MRITAAWRLSHSIVGRGVGVGMGIGGVVGVRGGGGSWSSFRKK
jgi:hypothetical protein